MSEDREVISGGYESTPSERVIGLWAEHIYETLDSPEDYHREIRKLPRNVVHVLCVEVIFWQVLNGGFWQYFYNSYGIMMNDAVEGLKAMGLTEHAEISVEARALLGEPFPDDRETRMALVGGNASDGIDSEPQTDRFIDAAIANEKQVWATIYAYAETVLTKHVT